VPADRSTFLSDELIDGCKFSKPDDCTLSFDAMWRSRYDLSLGIDVGRGHDLTVMWLLEIQDECSVHEACNLPEE
jgi:phage FluMu gp28-like protein